MTETPKKKTAPKKAAVRKPTSPKNSDAQPKAKAQASSFLPFDLPKVDLPKFDLPKFDLPKIQMPKFDLPKVDLPKVNLSKLDLSKVDLPKVDVPTQVTEVAERGRDLVTDSVKTARSAAGSVRKNVSETVVLVREVVGV